MKANDSSEGTLSVEVLLARVEAHIREGRLPAGIMTMFRDAARADFSASKMEGESLLVALRQAAEGGERIDPFSFAAGAATAALLIWLLEK